MGLLPALDIVDNELTIQGGGGDFGAIGGPADGGDFQSVAIEGSRGLERSVLEFGNGEALVGGGQDIALGTPLE